MAEKWSQIFSRKRATTALFFLTQYSSEAENSSAIWFILANQDRANQRWCITAQVKNDHFCDCFHPQNCPKNLYAHFYYPYFEGKTMLIGPKLYPSEVAVKFNGARNTMENELFYVTGWRASNIVLFFQCWQY